MKKTATLILSALALVLLARCDGGEDGALCITVSPEEGYALSGTAGTSSFAPASMTYTVQNICSEDIELSVEENVRWLDVDIAAFGGGSSESGTVTAGQSISVIIEVRYGTDDPERLNLLAEGAYSTDVTFEDDTNDDRVTREVNLTVNPAPGMGR